MNPERLNQDLKNIQELANNTDGRVRIVKIIGKPMNELVLELKYPTAPSKEYPNAIQDTTNVTIRFSSEYPKTKPDATITTPIFHPNISTGGRICIGKWIGTHGLDIFVKRIIKIITFDPTEIDANDPANSEASGWYFSKRDEFPSKFPTEKVIFPEKKAKLKWVNKN
jgi:ubiquitin-protein ligase